VPSAAIKRPPHKILPYQIGQPGGCVPHAPAKMSSFEKKPANGKMPEIAKHEIKNVIRVIGMCLRSPPIVVMSPGVFEPPCSMPCMTEPAPRNRHALKNACVPR
jgi:hypothetical protein